MVTGKGEKEINAEKFAVQSDASFTGKVGVIEITIVGPHGCELVVSASLFTGP